MRVSRKLALAVSTVLVPLGSIVSSVGGSGKVAAAVRIEPTFTKVVTLGDSYSAGTGARNHQFEYDPEDYLFTVKGLYSNFEARGSKCWRKSDENTGGLLAQRFAGGVANQQNLACAGAQKAELDAQIASLTYPNGGAGILVNMTAFGNDVRTIGGLAWPAVVGNCGKAGNPPCEIDPMNVVSPAEGTRIAGLAADSYRKLLSRMPNATIRVLSYPHIFEPVRAAATGQYSCSRGTYGYNTRGQGVDFSGAEANFIDGLEDNFNGLLRRVVASFSATNSNIKFVDVQPYYGDHGMCKEPPRVAINPVNVADYSPIGVFFNWEPVPNVEFSSLHPSTTGYQLNFAAVEDSLTNPESSLDGRTVAFRSVCGRGSTIMSVGGKTTIEQSGNNDPREFWKVREVAAGRYTLQNLADGTFIIGSTINQERLTQGAQGDRWLIRQEADGVVRLDHPNGLGLSATVQDGRPTSGSQLRMSLSPPFESDTGCLSKFQMYVASRGPLSRPLNVFDGQVLTLESSCGGDAVIEVTPDVNARILLSPNRNAASQKFRFKAVGDDLYEIRSVLTGLALDASPSEQAFLRQGGTTRKWRVVENGGTIELHLNDINDYVVDVPNANISSGFVWMWGYNGTCAQRFTPLVDATATPTSTVPVVTVTVPVPVVTTGVPVTTVAPIVTPSTTVVAPVTPDPPVLRTVANWPWARGLTSENVYRGDFDGDGKTDVLLRYPVDNTWRWDVGLSTGTGFRDAGNWFFGAGGTPDPVYTGDFNGDRKTDVLVRWFNGTKWGYYVALSTGTSFQASGDWGPNLGTSEPVSVGDFTGDGKSDILLRSTDGNAWTYTVAESNGSAFVNARNWTTSLGGSEPIQVGDFNGDAKADILLRYTHSGRTHYIVALSTGSSTGSSFSAASEWTTSLGYTPEPVYVGDFNGDGKSDILLRYNTGDSATNGNGNPWRYVVANSDGTKFVIANGSYAPALGGTTEPVYLGDYNGDKRADILLRYADPSNVYWTVGLTGAVGLR